MTSAAFTDMRLASSATVMVSEINTSRTTGAVGFSKPCTKASSASRYCSDFSGPLRFLDLPLRA